MTNRLFDEFHKVSAKEWKQKIQFDLKGADYNETLLTPTPEHITIKPFYHAEDLPSSSITPEKTEGWLSCERIYVTEAEKAVEKAKRATEKGAESILFVLHDKKIDLELLLGSMNPLRKPVYLEMHFLSTDVIKELLRVLDTNDLPVYLILDPIDDLNATGNWHFNQKKDTGLLAEILALIGNRETPGRDNIKTALSVNLGRYLNSGASAVQQLAYGMAHVNEYLNLMEQQGISPASLCPLFYCAAGHHYFFEIAKFRALRILWETLSSAYSNTNPAHLLVVPGKRNKTLYDYNVNMLRTTTEYMSAILGGADAVCTMPYDAIYHKDNEFGSRIARNQLLILKNESYFQAVNNPADGSYYIERLTHDMSEKALEIFKQIEAGGGYLQQLMDNTIQKKIKETAREEQEAFSETQRILVGSNKYMNTDDRMKDNLELDPFLKTNPKKTLVEPIIEKRLAEELEKKRLKQE